MAFILLIGLEIGKNVAFANGDNDWPTNGWVCPDGEDVELGTCDPNWNATSCTWSPGNSCSTTVEEPQVDP